MDKPNEIFLYIPLLEDISKYIYIYIYNTGINPLLTYLLNGHLFSYPCTYSFIVPSSSSQSNLSLAG